VGGTGAFLETRLRFWKLHPCSFFFFKTSWVISYYYV